VLKHGYLFDSGSGQYLFNNNNIYLTAVGLSPGGSELPPGDNYELLLYTKHLQI
jgi:hypothetical protein